MTDRENQIEEIILVVKEKMTDNASIDIVEDLVSFNGNDFDHIAEQTAEALYNAGYRKIPEGAVVLTKEEWNKLMGDTYTTKELDEIVAYKERVKAREVARDILTKLADDFRVDGMDVEYPLNRVKIYAKQYGVKIEE